MTTIDRDITLGELVTLHPELARELERRHLDYCCHGGATLGEACEAAGLDPAAVVDSLATSANAPSVPAWATFDAAQLADHLVVTHHRYLWDELPRIEALVAKVVTVHGERHPELADVAETFRALRADLEPHLVKEERVLFPMIRELASTDSLPSFHCGSLSNPISVMLGEHDTAGELLARLRELTGDYTPPVDACASYTALFAALEELERDTHEHVHKENHRLFPMAVELEERLAERGDRR
jgi:regulator of cell morphogenesis and NO signaling